MVLQQPNAASVLTGHSGTPGALIPATRPEVGTEVGTTHRASVAAAGRNERQFLKDE